MKSLSSASLNIVRMTLVSRNAANSSPIFRVTAERERSGLARSDRGRHAPKPFALVGKSLTLPDDGVRLHARKDRILSPFDEQGLVARRRRRLDDHRKMGCEHRANSARVFAHASAKGRQIFRDRFPRCLNIQHEEAREPIEGFLNMRGGYVMTSRNSAHLRFLSGANRHQNGKLKKIHGRIEANAESIVLTSATAGPQFVCRFSNPDSGFGRNNFRFGCHGNYRRNALTLRAI